MVNARLQVRRKLEAVLDSQFHDPMPEHILGNAERAGRINYYLAIAVEIEMEAAVATGERRQIMVHEVERCETELEVLVLRDLEVLHQREVALPEHRSVRVHEIKVGLGFSA